MIFKTFSTKNLPKILAFFPQKIGKNRRKLFPENAQIFTLYFFPCVKSIDTLTHKVTECCSYFVEQGCQMVSFETKNPNLGKFWRALHWEMLIYFMVIWNCLETFGIVYNHLVHLCSIFSAFGIMYQEKSCNLVV
jgi:hypothetical protein